MAKTPTDQDPWARILQAAKLQNADSTLPGLSQPATFRKETFSRGEPVAIQIKNFIEVPQMAASELALLDEHEEITFVTRHIQEKHIQANLDGYFRFGTTTGYRATEQNKAGRLGDPTEGRILTTFSNPQGRLDRFSYKNTEVASSFAPGMRHVVFETIVNDFCSCSTIGKFDQDQAATLRSHNNPDLSAYVTYDLHKLMTAIAYEVARANKFSGHVLLAKMVRYDHKDNIWTVPEVFQGKSEALSEWLDSTFIKPTIFEHEAEVRLVLVNPDKIGRLPESESLLELQAASIADAIVDQGTF